MHFIPRSPIIPFDLAAVTWAAEGEAWSLKRANIGNNNLAGVEGFLRGPKEPLRKLHRALNTVFGSVSHQDVTSKLACETCDLSRQASHDQARNRGHTLDTGLSADTIDSPEDGITAARPPRLVRRIVIEVHKDRQDANDPSESANQADFDYEAGAKPQLKKGKTTTPATQKLQMAKRQKTSKMGISPELLGDCQEVVPKIADQGNGKQLEANVRKQTGKRDLSVLEFTEQNEAKSPISASNWRAGDRNGRQKEKQQLCLKGPQAVERRSSAKDLQQPERPEQKKEAPAIEPKKLSFKTFLQKDSGGQKGKLADLWADVFDEEEPETLTDPRERIRQLLAKQGIEPVHLASAFPRVGTSGRRRGRRRQRPSPETSGLVPEDPTPQYTADSMGRPGEAVRGPNVSASTRPNPGPICEPKLEMEESNGHKADRNCTTNVRSSPQGMLGPTFEGILLIGDDHDEAKSFNDAQVFRKTRRQSSRLQTLDNVNVESRSGRVASASTSNSPDQVWSCQRCTFDNILSDRCCSICETPHIGKAAKRDSEVTALLEADEIVAEDSTDDDLRPARLQARRYHPTVTGDVERKSMAGDVNARDDGSHAGLEEIMDEEMEDDISAEPDDGVADVEDGEGAARETSEEGRAKRIGGQVAGVKRQAEDTMRGTALSRQSYCDLTVTGSQGDRTDFSDKDKTQQRNTGRVVKPEGQSLPHPRPVEQWQETRLDLAPWTRTCGPRSEKCNRPCGGRRKFNRERGTLRERAPRRASWGSRRFKSGWGHGGGRPASGGQERGHGAKRGWASTKAIKRGRDSCSSGKQPRQAGNGKAAIKAETPGG